MMQATFTFLGTGASTGVPVIGCDCSVCKSSSHYNKRLRPSALLHIGEKTILIDVGPDFRSQALKQDLKKLDGLLITHTHFDHIAGLDELRTFCFMQKRPMPCLLSKASLNDLEVRYHYLFEPEIHSKSTTVKIHVHTLKGQAGTVEFLGIPISYLTYFQGGMEVTGFIFGNLAYITDIKDYNESVIESIKGVKILILSALRKEKSSMQFNLDEALDFAKNVGAEKTYITHIAHDLGHAETNAILPSNVTLSYDGLKINFEI